MENTTVMSGVLTVRYTVNFFLFYSIDSYANESIFEV